MTCPAASGINQAPDEAGFSLIEVLVSSAVLMLVGSISTAGMVQMYATAGRVEALAIAQERLHVAYQRLDKELRYVAAIGDPSRGTAVTFTALNSSVRTAAPGHCSRHRPVP